MTEEMSLSLVERVSEFEVKAREIEETANSLVVDEAGSVTATEILGQIASIKKRAEEVRKTLVKPLQDKVNEINARFKEALQPVVNADAVLRAKLQAFREKQERERREAEERLRKLMEKEQKKAEKKAEKKGEAPPPPPPMPVLPEPPRAIKTEAGTVFTKKVLKWRVVDFAKVPDEYKMIDDKAVNTAIKYGTREIPGLEIYEVEELVVRGR